MPLIPVSINNSPETGVVVVGVVTVVGPLGWPTANDALGTAIVCARRRDRVLVIVAPPLRWQYPLEIPEYNAVLLERERAARRNQAQRAHRLTRKFVDRNAADRIIRIFRLTRARLSATCRECYGCDQRHHCGTPQARQ